MSNKTVDLKTHEDFLYDEKLEAFRSLAAEEKLMFVDARLSAVEKSIKDIISFLNQVIKEEND